MLWVRVESDNFFISQRIYVRLWLSIVHFLVDRVSHGLDEAESIATYRTATRYYVYKIRQTLSGGITSWTILKASQIWIHNVVIEEAITGGIGVSHGTDASNMFVLKFLIFLKGCF